MGPDVCEQHTSNIYGPYIYIGKQGRSDKDKEEVNFDDVVIRETEMPHIMKLSKRQQTAEISAISSEFIALK